MAHFERLNKNINEVLNKLLESQPLCKLLQSTSSNPLAETDIKDPTSLLFKHIYPFAKVPESTQTAVTYLNVFFDDFTMGDTDAVKEGHVIFTVVTHADLWKIKGGLRPFSIMSEVDSLFNNNRAIGLKKLQFERGKFIWANDKFSGYQVTYRMVNAN